MWTQKKKKKEECLGTCRIGRPGGKWEQPSHSNNFGTGSPPPALTLLVLLCPQARCKGCKGTRREMDGIEKHDVKNTHRIHLKRESDFCFSFLSVSLSITRHRNLPLYFARDVPPRGQLESQEVSSDPRKLGSSFFSWCGLPANAGNR